MLRALALLTSSVIFALPALGTAEAQDLNRREVEAYQRIVLAAEQSIRSEEIVTTFCTSWLARINTELPNEVPQRELISFMRGYQSLSGGDADLKIGRERSQLILFPLNEIQREWASIQGPARKLALAQLTNVSDGDSMAKRITFVREQFDLVQEEYLKSYSNSGRADAGTIIGLQEANAPAQSLSRALNSACLRVSGFAQNDENHNVYTFASMLELELSRLAASTTAPASVQAQAQCITAKLSPLIAELQTLAVAPRGDTYANVFAMAQEISPELIGLVDLQVQSLGLPRTASGATCTP